MMRQMTPVYTGHTTVVAVVSAVQAMPDDPKSTVTSRSMPCAATSEPNVSASEPGIFVVVTTTGVALAVSAADVGDRPRQRRDAVVRPEPWHDQVC